MADQPVETLYVELAVKTDNLRRSIDDAVRDSGTRLRTGLLGPLSEISKEAEKAAQNMRIMASSSSSYSRSAGPVSSFSSSQDSASVRMLAEKMDLLASRLGALTSSRGPQSGAAVKAETDRQEYLIRQVNEGLARAAGNSSAAGPSGNDATTKTARAVADSMSGVFNRVEDLLKTIKEVSRQELASQEQFNRTVNTLSLSAQGIKAAVDQTAASIASLRAAIGSAGVGGGGGSEGKEEKEEKKSGGGLVGAIMSIAGMGKKKAPSGTEAEDGDDKSPEWVTCTFCGQVYNRHKFTDNCPTCGASAGKAVKVGDNPPLQTGRMTAVTSSANKQSATSGGSAGAGSKEALEAVAGILGIPGAGGAAATGTASAISGVLQGLEDSLSKLRASVDLSQESFTKFVQGIASADVDFEKRKIEDTPAEQQATDAQELKDFVKSLTAETQPMLPMEGIPEPVEVVKTAAEDVAEQLTSTKESLATQLSLFNDAADQAKKAAETLNAEAPKVPKTILDNMVAGAQTFFTNAGNIINNAAKAAADGIPKTVGGAFAAITGTISNLGKGIGDNVFKPVGDLAAKVASDVPATIGYLTTVAKKFEGLTVVVSNVADNLGRTFENGARMAGATTEQLSDNVAGFAESTDNLVDSVQEASDASAAGAQSAADIASSLDSNTGQLAVVGEEIVQSGSKVAEEIGSAASQAANQQRDSADSSGEAPSNGPMPTPQRESGGRERPGIGDMLLGAGGNVLRDISATYKGSGGDVFGSIVAGARSAIGQITGIAEASGAAASGLGVLAQAAGAGLGIWAAWEGALKPILGFLREIGTEGMNMAARIQTLQAGLETTAKNAGVGLSFAQEKMQALQRTGITTTASIESLMKFLSANLPIDNIEKLARAGQNLAVAYGRNSSEVFQRFTAVIMTGNSALLDTIGIQKNVSQMYEEYADKLGKTGAKALTDVERRQAVIAGLIKETQQFDGLYEKAMDTLDKRMQSMDRYKQEATQAFGQTLLPFKSIDVDVQEKFWKGLNSVFVEMEADSKGKKAAKLDEFGNQVLTPLGKSIKEFATAVEDALKPVIAIIPKFLENIGKFLYSAIQGLNAIGGVISPIVNVVVNLIEVIAGAGAQILKLASDFAVWANQFGLLSAALFLAFGPLGLALSLLFDRSKWDTILLVVKNLLAELASAFTFLADQFDNLNRIMSGELPRSLDEMADRAKKAGDKVREAFDNMQVGVDGVKDSVRDLQAEFDKLYESEKLSYAQWLKKQPGGRRSAPTEEGFEIAKEKQFLDVARSGGFSAEQEEILKSALGVKDLRTLTRDQLYQTEEVKPLSISEQYDAFRESSGGQSPYQYVSMTAEEVGKSLDDLNVKFKDLVGQNGVMDVGKLKERDEEAARMYAELTAAQQSLTKYSNYGVSTGGGTYDKYGTGGPQTAQVSVLTQAFKEWQGYNPLLAFGGTTQVFKPEVMDWMKDNPLAAAAGGDKDRDKQNQLMSDTWKNLTEAMRQMKDAENKLVGETFPKQLKDFEDNFTKALLDLDPAKTKAKENAVRDNGRALVRLEKDIQREARDMVRDGQKQIEEIEKEYQERRLDQKEAFERQMREMEEDYHRNLEEAAESRDAKRVFDLMRNYEYEKKKALEAQKLQQDEEDKQKKKAIDKIPQNEEDARKKLQDSYERRKQQLADNLEDQMELIDQNFKDRYDDMVEQHDKERQLLIDKQDQQLKDLKESNQDKVNEMITHWAKIEGLSKESADKMIKLAQDTWGKDGDLMFEMKNFLQGVEDEGFVNLQIKFLKGEAATAPTSQTGLVNAGGASSSLGGTGTGSMIIDPGDAPAPIVTLPSGSAPTTSTLPGSPIGGSYNPLTGQTGGFTGGATTTTPAYSPIDVGIDKDKVTTYQYPYVTAASGTVLSKGETLKLLGKSVADPNNPKINRLKLQFPPTVPNKPWLSGVKVWVDSDAINDTLPDNLPSLSMAEGGFVSVSTPTNILMGDAGPEMGFFLPKDKKWANDFLGSVGAGPIANGGGGSRIDLAVSVRADERFSMEFEDRLYDKIGQIVTEAIPTVRVRRS